MWSQSFDHFVPGIGAHMQCVYSPMLGHFNQPHMTLGFALFLGLWLLLRFLAILYTIVYSFVYRIVDSFWGNPKLRK